MANEGGSEVFLLCGLTGSGKTTYAKKLEIDGVKRLSVDERVYARHGRYGVDYPEDRYFELEQPVVFEVEAELIQLIEQGVPVVIDHGLWVRGERARYKELVEEHGGRWRLLYFKADTEVLRRRLRERNHRTDGNALTVTDEALDDFLARFEEPVDEGEEVIVQR
ncbi:Predicted kinase [Parafrankia irregularis]|uniref:Predicted kinase n=1 Tax=Parafrankia irregularis TaxID=795642 RepID=A0A0S4R2Z0_9ACTN|nr:MULTISPECIES: ATP-binding protein [Parafrankia]MBE3206610.1 ATP-binding protein [Parafrankia sp. CH37]MBE3206616.1 ATP-binding protein [Parafrankia sp. CH37]MBE3206622.1 ATP-binding protein [Parafrankia sp. CH37]MBE3206732.1 ATP-binding protein [Parafrankia sp. CH37]CUU61270.1 Predicted kinase [Parafrankia irregularis]